MAKEFISKEMFVETFKIKPWLASIIMRLMKIKKLNRFYEKQLKPHNFSSYAEMYKIAFDELNIRVNFDTSFMNQLKGKAFVTVSNHAWGFMDPGILIFNIGKQYPNFKITTNFLLSKIEPAKEFIIPVNPFEDKKGKRKGMGAAKTALDTLASGNPVSFFPAGEVATFLVGKKGKRKRIIRPKVISDGPWYTSTFRLIRKAQVPVVPIYFEGTNSRLFHFLGRIHPYIRTFMLISEFFKQKNATVNVKTGQIVYPETYNLFETDEELCEYFRVMVFKLKRKKDEKKNEL